MTAEPERPPLDHDAARAALDEGAAQLAAGEFEAAGAAYSRAADDVDPQVAAAALLGLGEALFRLDRDRDAETAWEAILALPETPSSYLAWRNVAGARVRSGDLRAALEAYRQADRRAPAEDKAEIASRLGWLAKELGDRGASRRYFARSRESGPAVPLAYVILGLTVIVSLAASAPGGLDIERLLQLDKVALAQGEYWRLFSVTLVHAGFLHLFLNMYALYLVGPIVEGVWGSRWFLAFYLLAAATASTASFLFSDARFGVGASGAIFGLVGVLLSGVRAHNPMLDRRARAIVPQLGMIVVINLVFGFAAGGVIDNSAHIGGLLAGLWLGLVVPPGRVRTLSSYWVGGPAASQARTVPPVLVIAGVFLLVAVIAVGIAVGSGTA
jgi:membrane associated rhomboid family serine protease